MPLLALLALPHARNLAARSACESVKPILVEARRPCCQESLCAKSTFVAAVLPKEAYLSLCTPPRCCAKRSGVVEALSWNRDVWGF